MVKICENPVMLSDVLQMIIHYQETEAGVLWLAGLALTEVEVSLRNWSPKWKTQVTLVDKFSW